MITTTGRKVRALERLGLEERRVALREQLATAKLQAAAAPAKRQSETLHEMQEPMPVSTAPRAANPPRWSGYSEMVQPEPDTDRPANALQRDERAEVAPKAQRREGRNEGPEGPNRPVSVAEPAPLAAPRESAAGGASSRPQRGAATAPGGGEFS